MEKLPLGPLVTVSFIVILISILAFSTKPIVVQVARPLKNIRKEIGKGFRIPGHKVNHAGDAASVLSPTIFDDDDGGDDGGWTWGDFGSSVGTGAAAGAVSGAVAGAVAGSFAGGVGAGPGAAAGGVAGLAGGAAAGAVTYAWHYAFGSVILADTYYVSESALDSRE